MLKDANTSLKYMSSFRGEATNPKDSKKLKTVVLSQTNTKTNKHKIMKIRKNIFQVPSKHDVKYLWLNEFGKMNAINS